jgi:hypothetical protein
MSGENAQILLRAAIGSTGFPDSVPASKENLALFTQIEQEIADMPPGVVPDTAWDYTDDEEPEPAPPEEQGSSEEGGEPAGTAPDILWMASTLPPGQSLLLAAGGSWLHEARGPHGEWVHGPGAPAHGYTHPDNQRLFNSRSKYHLPQDHPWFKANPVSADSIVAGWDDTPASERIQGMRWYSDAHNVAGAIAGGDYEKGAALLAAFSPQVSWPENLFNASRSALENRALGPGDGLITRAMQAQVQKILDGAGMSAIKAPKTRAFGTLIQHNGDPEGDHLGQVVIDRHAMSVATGKRMTKVDLDSSPIGDDRFYQHVADQYREAAIRISQKEGREISPHQVQAATWLRQQRLNQAEDSAAGGEGNTARLQKGRTTLLKKNTAAWKAYQEAHNLPGVAGLVSDDPAAIELANLLDAGWEQAEIDPSMLTGED